MVDSALNKNSIVNLDEFERRLRGSSNNNGNSGDPLADLARLVGNDDVQPAWRNNIFSQPAKGVRGVSTNVATTEPTARIEPSFEMQLPASNPAMGHTASSQPVAGQQAQPDLAAAAMPAMQTSFARQLQELHARTESMRQAANDAGMPYQIAPEDAQSQNYNHLGQAPNSPDYAHDLNPVHGKNYGEATYAPAANSNRPIFILATIFAVGLFALGIVFATRSDKGLTASAVPIIKAENAPVKVAPTPQVDAKVANQNASILDSAAAQKAEAGQAPTSKVVASAEQPVDLAQLPPPVATAAAPVDAAPNLDGFDFHKVKTIAVRPDGTLIGEPAAPVAAAVLPSLGLTPPTMPAGLAPADNAVEPSQVQPIAPIEKPKAKTTARASKTVKHIPQAKAASAAVGQTKPLQLAQITHPQQADETKAASDAAPTQGSTASGTFSVQLAAPGSEGDAKTAMTRLASRYGAQLEGHHLSYHRVDVNGKSIFRVRLQGLSHKAAIDICVNLKKQGGSCFVARN